VFHDGLFDGGTLLAGVAMDPPDEEKEPSGAFADLVGVVRSAAVVATDEAPEADVAGEVEEDDGVGARESGVDSSR